MYIYIYTHTVREKERERERKSEIERERERERIERHTLFTSTVVACVEAVIQLLTHAAMLILWNDLLLLLSHHATLYDISTCVYIRTCICVYVCV